MIRTASPDDIPSLIAGYDWLFAPPGSKPPDWDPDAAAERLRRVLASDRSHVLVAEDAGTVVGFASVYLDIESVRFGQRAFVEDLAVHPGHRSRGYGKQLLDAAKEWARENGAAHLELDSGFGRTDAHRFYEREGADWSSRSFGWLL